MGETTRQGVPHEEALGQSGLEISALTAMIATLNASLK
jgi:hypothetical protein